MFNDVSIRITVLSSTHLESLVS